MILEQLVYLFTSDTKEFQQGLDKADKATENLEKQIIKTDKASESLGQGFTDLLATAGGALTAMLSLGALTQGIVTSAEYVTNLDRVSERLNININDLNAWTGAVERAGGNADTLQQSLTVLNERLVDASTFGAGEGLEIFNKFGIQLKKSNGEMKTSMDLLPELNKAFQTMSKQEVAGIGEILSIDESLVTVLQQTPEELDKIISKQKSLMSVTDEQVAIFKNFDNSLKDTNQAFRGLFVEIGSDIIPVFSYLLEKVQNIVGFFTENKDFTVALFSAIGIAITAYALPAIIKFGIASITAFAPFYAIGAVVVGVAGIFALLYDDIMTFLDGGNSAFERLLNWLGLTGEEIQSVREAFSDLGAFIGDMFEVWKAGWQLFGSVMVEVVKGAFLVIEPILFIIGRFIAKAIEGISFLARGVGKVTDFLGFTDSEEEINATMQQNVNMLNSGGLSSQTPLSGMSSNTMSLSNSTKSNSVKIDKVEVNTQATDAEGIASAFSGSLQEQLINTTNNFDDGIEG